MASIKMTRRAFAGGLAALGAAASLPASAQAARLRMMWWGGPDRARRTNEIIQAYVKANPGLQIDGESVGWGDYWPRVATQTAGGNAPDILQMDYRYLAEYAKRGALLALDGLRAGPLKLAGFNPPDFSCGTIGGKLYAIPCGWNSTAMHYNVTALERLGAPKPKPDQTWADLAEWSAQVTTISGGKIAGVENCGWNEQVLEVWVRQRGRALYTEDGQMAFTRDDVAEWLEFWFQLQQKKATTAPDVQASSKYTPETSMMVTGKAVMVSLNSNQIVAYQAAMQDRVELAMFPQGPAGSKPGQYLKPAMLMSIPARGKNPEASAKFIDFLLTDPAAAELGGVERGVPPSTVSRAAIASKLDEQAMKQVKYVEHVSGRVGPLPPPPPQGAGEIEKALIRINEQVSFGRMTVPKAADQFVAEVKAALLK